MSPAVVPAPVYLIRGEDPSLVSSALTTLLTELAGDEPGFAVEDLSGDEPDIGAIIDACSTPPFLADRRVVVVRDIGRLKVEHVDPIIAYVSDPLDTTVLVLVAGSGATPTRLLNAVKKTGHVVEAGPDLKNRKTWVVGRMKDADVRLDAAAGELIRLHLGEDVGRLEPLLNLLAAVYGVGAKVGAEQVRPFLGEAGGVAPWDLTDAIDRGDAASALAQLHRMMEGGGRHALQILAGLHGHYGAMLRADGSGVSSDNEAGQLLGMHPFRAGKVVAQSRRLGSANVGRAIELMADAELDLKGVRAWSPELVLEVLVGRLSRLTPRAATPTRSTGSRR